LVNAPKQVVGRNVLLDAEIIEQLRRCRLAVVFGVRLPRGLSPAFVNQVIAMSDGIAGLSGAMRGLVAARDAVLGAIAAIDTDMKKLVRASDACRRLMTIPGVGQLTALAFTAAIDDPGRFRRSRDLGAYLGLVPRRHQSGEIDYIGGISKVGDRRIRTLLYEAANVMLTRYKGELKLKDWAFAMARRSSIARDAGDMRYVAPDMLDLCFKFGDRGLRPSLALIEEILMLGSDGDVHMQMRGVVMHSGDALMRLEADGPAEFVLDGDELFGVRALARREGDDQMIGPVAAWPHSSHQIRSCVRTFMSFSSVWCRNSRSAVNRLCYACCHFVLIVNLSMQAGAADIQRGLSRSRWDAHWLGYSVLGQGAAAGIDEKQPLRSCLGP
jgi:hypothetical protein